MYTPHQLADADPIDLVNDSLLVLDLNGRVLRCNAAAERLYGWRRGQAVGDSVDRLFGLAPPSDQAQLLDRDASEQEVCRPTADGGTVWVKLRRVLRRDGEGVPSYVIETATPTGSFRLAQIELELAQYRCRSMFHGVASPLLELELGGLLALLARRFTEGVTDLHVWLVQHPEDMHELMRHVELVDLNQGAANLLGDSAGNQRRSVESWWSKDGHIAFLDCVLDGLRGVGQHSVRTRLLNRDGVPFEALLSIRFPTNFQLQTRVIVSVLDIGEQYRAQARLKQNDLLYEQMFRAPGVSTWLLDATGAALLYGRLHAEGVVDLVAYAEQHPEFVQAILTDVTVVDVNQTTLELFGATRRDQIVGGSTAPFWIPGRYAQFIGAVEAMYNQRLDHLTETPMRTLDGREIWVLFHVTASLDLQVANRTLLTIIDVSERVKARHALLSTHANFAYAARFASLGTLADSISQEVNRPLRAIVRRSKIVQHCLGNEGLSHITSLRRLTTVIIADARRASAIVGGIRAMATPGTNARRHVSINALTRECMDIMRQEARRLGIEETLLLADDLPDIVGDPIKLSQVLVNLILNAFRAMEQTARPRLLVRTLHDGAGGIRLELEDNGPGVPQHHLASLFQRFFTTRPGGIGMGLAICRTIVEGHAGTIEGANLATGGARFTLRLPLSAAT